MAMPPPTERHLEANVPRGYYDKPVVKGPVWTWEVPVYIWLGGLSGGAFLASAAARVFGTEEDAVSTGRGFFVSALTSLLCPPLLIADLGRPERFHHMLRVFKPASPMNLGAWTLMVFSPLSVSRAIAQAGQDRMLPGLAGALGRLLPRRLIELAGSFFGMLLAGYTGVLLSSTNVPIWAKSKLLPAIFTASAVASGAASVNLASNAARGTREKLAAIESLATVTEAVATLAYLGQLGRTADPLVRGRHRIAFWVGAIGLGQALPLGLHAIASRGNSRIRTIGTLAATATVIGSLFLRWSIFAAGRDSANDQAAALDLQR